CGDGGGRGRRLRAQGRPRRPHRGRNEGIRRRRNQADAQLMPTTDPTTPKRYWHTTGSRGEFQFGFSRAIRHGTVVRVSGTAGIGPDGSVVSDDVVEQMRAALQTMKEALAEL